nr:hypothetical protein [Bradyrhizobium canariense]
MIAELGLPLAGIEHEVAERPGYVTLYRVVVQVQVDDVLQVTANRFSAHKHPAWRHPNGILGERCGHGIDVFAIVGLGEILLQVGILIVRSLLSDSANAPDHHQRSGKYDRTHHRRQPWLMRPAYFTVSTRSISSSRAWQYSS